MTAPIRGDAQARRGAGTGELAPPPASALGRPMHVKALVRAEPSWRTLFARARWRARKLRGQLPLRNTFPRTPRYPSQPIALARAGIPLAFLLLLLLAFGVLLARGASHVHEGSFVDSLAHAITRPAIAGPIALVILFVCGRLLRAVRLAWLAWTAGPVVVPDFNMPQAVTGTTPAQVTALFRDQLGLLRLGTAKPSPGATPEGSFLEVLASGTVSQSDWLHTALTLVRASWPGYAFEVSGMIQQRAGRKGCGITVQALRLPGEPGPLVEVWEDSWELAAQKAADGAVAALLPRTRLCRGPWASWQRFRPPRELFTAYREAGELVAERRYDEALGRYRDALARDPTNLTVALQLGQLQEKIGLFIGALTTYQRILSLDNPGRHPLPSGLYRRQSRREWERSVLIAKYRQIVLLSQGSLVKEWCGSFEDEPLNYRDELRKHFKRELEPLTIARHDPATDAIGEAIALLIEQRHSDEAPVVLSRLLPFAYKAGYELARSLARVERNAWEQPLTRRTIGLTLATLFVRAEIRGDNGEGQDLPDDLISKLEHAARFAGWRPWAWAGWAPPQPFRRTWQQHYNAACLYAMPLALTQDSFERENLEAERRDGRSLLAPPRDERTEALVRLAVGRLERAASRANSEFVVTRRDWVLEEDLDLRGLRHHPEFRAFAVAYFPSREDPAGHIFDVRDQQQARRFAKPRLGSRAHTAQTDYAHELLTAVSTRWHELWHQRFDRGGAADPHTLVRWWSEEAELWRMYGDVVRSHFNWSLRQRLLETASERAVNDGLAPVIARYRAHEDIDRPYALGTTPRARVAAPAGVARHTLDFQDFKGALVGDCMPSHADANPLKRHETLLTRCVELLRHTDAEALDLSAFVPLADLCHVQAATWQTLEECLTGCIRDHSTAAARICERIKNAERVWGQAHERIDAGRGARA
jgi:tetratricopeptide (TPR) repeat protein